MEIHARALTLQTRRFYKMDLSQITVADLDTLVDEYIIGEHVDPGVLERDLQRVIKLLESSPRCKSAIEGAVMHVVARGPDHVGCGITQTSAAFFIIALKLAEMKHKAAPDIAELERLMSLEPAPIPAPKPKRVRKPKAKLQE
jgi:hypothetical protein